MHEVVSVVSEHAVMAATAVHAIVARLQDREVAVISPPPRPRDNRSHAASEGRYRGPDLTVTAGELNAGAGVGRLGAFQETDDGRETSDEGDR